LFQAANGGSLFLDEVAELPLHMQVKLLRAIQERAVKPIGAQQEVPVDVRILSATHKVLSQEIVHGRFRQDLYYRINVIELRVPPLRERLPDLPQLAEHILKRFATQGRAPILRLSAQALAKLEAYPFPGNVRELENILERAATLCEGQSIQARDLQLPDAESQPGAPPAAMSAMHAPGQLEDYLEDKEKTAIMAALEKTRWNPPPPPGF